MCVNQSITKFFTWQVKLLEVFNIIAIDPPDSQESADTVLLRTTTKRFPRSAVSKTLNRKKCRFSRTQQNEGKWLLIATVLITFVINTPLLSVRRCCRQNCPLQTARARLRCVEMRSCECACAPLLWRWLRNKSNGSDFLLLFSLPNHLRWNIALHRPPQCRLLAGYIWNVQSNWKDCD